MSVARNDTLLGYVRAVAVVPGVVTLASEAAVDRYVDLRRVTLSRYAPLVGVAMLDLVRDLDYDAVGGLTMGADPVATAMLHVATLGGRTLDAFVVRKEAKAHGLQRRVEGPSLRGRRVLVVDDVVTSGSSALAAVAATLAEGAHVVAVAAVVDRGAAAVRKFSVNRLPYRFLYSYEQLVAEAPGG